MSNILCYGKAMCPASCGEIIQGVIENKNLLITCPISLYSVAEVIIYEKKREFRVKTSNEKSLCAAKKTLKYFGEQSKGVAVRLSSDIPRSIGLASSTADITATCLATASALNKVISPDSIADIALSIEPSDGIMYKDAILFDYISGKVRHRLGPLPKMKVYILDTYEEIDTVKFEESDLKQQRLKKQGEVVEALELALSYFRCNKKELLGQAMIKSALAHQNILPKPHLPEILDLGKRHGAIGVNIAHSGSAMGIFFNEDYKLKQDFFNDIDMLMRKHKKRYRIIRAKTGNAKPEIF